MIVKSDAHSSDAYIQEQRSLAQQVRREMLQKYRVRLQTSNEPPIRIMARVVQDIERECIQRNIDKAAIRLELVNRTIGDVNVRFITECEGEDGGPGDYRLLADELGIALPGEKLHGHTATGAVYNWLRSQMLEAERLLLEHGYDPRIYDITGIGNPVLREWLAQSMQQWGLAVTTQHVSLGLGATDCIDKVLRGLAFLSNKAGNSAGAILFPAPGFNVPEWQAVSYGYRLHKVSTLPEHNFKLTGEQLAQILKAHPDISIIYLTITNNPTTFAYTPAELRAFQDVLGQYQHKGRRVYLLADLAYVGTGDPQEDQERMQALCSPDVLPNMIFVSSFSKTHTLTGERFGWVTIGDPQLASNIGGSWTNSVGSLPGEWQLRFMAYYRLFQENPRLIEKIRNLYRLRRSQLRTQLQRLDDQLQLFERIYLDDGATIYNWSKLRAGEDCFSIFDKTGIAGIPGSVFGYSDEYIRFSIGILPVITN